MNDVAEQMASVIIVSAEVLFLYVLVVYMIPRTRTDHLRHKLFKLRDSLFWMPGKREISFDEKAYTLLRQRINGLIRFADRLNFRTSVVSQIAHRIVGPTGPGFRDRFRLACESLTPETREKLESIKEDVDKAIFRHLFWGNPPVFLFYWAYGWIKVFSRTPTLVPLRVTFGETAGFNAIETEAQAMGSKSWMRVRQHAARVPQLKAVRD